MTGRLLKAIGLAVAVTATTGLVDAQAVAPNPTTVEVEFHPLPEGKAIFSAILAHSNGKVYVGGCYNVARLIEFDPKTRAMRVVARMTSRALEGGGPDLKDPVLLGDLGPGRFPQTRWKFAQDKIHTQLLEGRDGRVQPHRWRAWRRVRARPPQPDGRGRVRPRRRVRFVRGPAHGSQKASQ